jgi:hypothetical protein
MIKNYIKCLIFIFIMIIMDFIKTFKIMRFMIIKVINSHNFIIIIIKVIEIQFIINIIIIIECRFMIA